MATPQVNTNPTPAATKNSLRNEIVAISLFALSALLTLCLISYNPNDNSWNTTGAAATRNLIGAIGSNVASTLFQIFGLAAYLFPVLLVLIAWRRFRVRRIHAPLWRIAGLALLVLCASATFTLMGIRPLFDASVRPGGMLGALISGLLTSGLNTVGASITLAALAAIGLLLATNFSFARMFEYLKGRRETDAELAEGLWSRIRSWWVARKARREAARAEATALKAERAAALQAEEELMALPQEKRVAAYLDEVESKHGPGHAAATTQRTGAKVGVPGEREPVPVVIETDIKVGAGDGSPSTTRTRTATAKGADGTAAVDDMVRTAEVVRTEGTGDAETVATAAPVSPSKERKPNIFKPHSAFKLPKLEFLNPPPPHNEQADEELLEIAKRVAEKCQEFNVKGQIKHICPGPVVTTYEFKPDPGVKYSRVTGLVDDLCLALKAESIRIDRMPGKSHVGIEVPNPIRETIYLREVLESRAFRESNSKLTIALGKTIDGLNYVTDLAKMPHLLIAGATGAGKSVGVNSLLVSILYKARPDEVKFILVDPKRLELGLYADIPHLATPIITDPKRAAIALKWAVSEMERRYKELAGWGVRNIDGFNVEVMRRNAVEDYDESGEPHRPLPYIVIIIDELADLMMVSGHEVEESITRLAQMARAVGIHLVLATQRPSVDVITGLIKANFPSRISFRVSSKVDSRTIIDANGAEGLLGRGDMLFLPPGTSRLVRVHGAYVDEAEINKIVSDIKQQSAPAYDESITQSEDEALGLEDTGGGDRDELFEDALRICVEMKRASTSVLQRRLRVGYGRAAAILDRFEREGLIGQADGARPRPVMGRAYELVGEWDEQAASQ
jgi:S-DNA-T family DNA segregation ATPase FtsK/SpoIIIE